ncbi:MAG: argininosuccinate lyase [Candidatus Methanoplasma sp.]|jgi:argininosuccinate lyase|nr:argininosuccinate lyase [Candidatus Methanoplasma sp.]
MGKALWSGRFEGGMDSSTLAFTSSLDVDSALAFYDAMGSIAHAEMLGARGVIPKGDAEAIVRGLRDIAGRIRGGGFDMDPSLEDVHTNIENSLTEAIGPAGGRLHTGRSRNDQAVTDLRMFLRDACTESADGLRELAESLLRVAEAHADAVMPGFTHMQHAQPITLAQHLLAHVFRLLRDADRFMDARRRMNLCPLGSAAMAGTTYPIDRDMTARLLGFDGPTENSLDSVSSRDFAAEAAFCAAMAMVDASSLCEEIVLWSSQEFGFVELDDRYATGSSIMPQKKNPDVAELARGRAGRAIGDLASVLIMSKGLPLSYNRDLQEDKGAVMDSLSVLSGCLGILAKAVSTARFDRDRMRGATRLGFMNATDLADYLATKGVPFREAHGIAAEAVRMCISRGMCLEDMSAEEMAGLSDRIGGDVFEAISIEACVERRRSAGGTSSQSVKAQADLARERLAALAAETDSQRKAAAALWARLMGEATE